MVSGLSVSIYLSKLEQDKEDLTLEQHAEQLMVALEDELIVKFGLVALGARV